MDDSVSNSSCESEKPNIKFKKSKTSVKQKEKIRKEMIKRDSKKLQSVRRNAINVIDEQRMITDTESELMKLKSKEYDLKKALSNIEKN